MKATRAHGDFPAGHERDCSRAALSPRLGVANDSLDSGEALTQTVLDAVHEVVDRAYGERGIDAAVKVDDLALGGLSDTNVMNFTETGDAGGK